MAQVERIRYLLHVKGLSQRKVAKMVGVSRHTVARYADSTDVPKYTRSAPYPTPVLTEEFQTEIRRLWGENQYLPKKQRWIGRTIYEALVELGYQGSESTVRRHLAALRKEQRSKPAFSPLEFDPGEVMEMDWGEAMVTLAGQATKVQILSMRLRWSGMPFVIAYPNQKQEAMFDGLQRGFYALGGAPEKLTADNLRQAVAKVLEGRNRKEQDAFLSFRTHFLVESNFCTPASGHEKGSVENLIGFAQRNIVGPRLMSDSWEHLQAVLWERCLKYAERTFWGEKQSVLERWKREQAFFKHKLPEQPYDCGRFAPVTSNKVSCVTFETCRYSVPVRYANQKLSLRAYWDRIDIYNGLQLIASHPRCYEREQEVLDLDHYLELLFKKPGALDHAKAFRRAKLPAVYHRFRTELRRRNPKGDREFVQILMLHREFSVDKVQAALQTALSNRTVDLGVVRQLLLKMDATGPRPTAHYVGDFAEIQVQQPQLGLYDRLLKRGVVH